MTSAGEISQENRAPASAPASSSLATISAEPLGPPMGSSDPSRATAGSVVGRPSGPTAQSGGIVSPRAAARRIFSFTPVRAVSTSTGGGVAVGKAQAIGLLHTTGRRVPQATVWGGPSVVAWPIIPASTACRA
jgi:hypothetical protein